MIKVNSPKQCDILIVGGGTAGLMAAVAAAERGARVIVAEKADTRRSGGGATGNDHFACYIPGYHESVDSYMHELEQGMCKGADPRVQRVFAERSFEIVKDWENGASICAHLVMSMYLKDTLCRAIPAAS